MVGALTFGVWERSVPRGSPGHWPEGPQDYSPEHWPEGPQDYSPGQRPGKKAYTNGTPCKGMTAGVSFTESVLPFQGGKVFRNSFIPRALPWARIFRPFRPATVGSVLVGVGPVRAQHEA